LQSGYIDGTFRVTADEGENGIPSEDGILDLSLCANLTMLMIQDVPGLKALKLPAICPQLRRLAILECASIKEINIPICANNSMIAVIECSNAEGISFAKGDSVIRKLCVDTCGEISALDLSSLRAVEVEIMDCKSLDTIDFRGCTDIRRIISNSTAVASFSSEFPNIISAARSNREVKNMLRKAGVTLQEDVDLKARNIAVIGNSEQTAKYLKNATKIGEVKYEDGIITAIIDGKYKIDISNSDVLDFSKCEKLQEMRIENVPNVKTIKLPENKNNLTCITIDECRDLNALDVSGFTNVAYIDLTRCNKLDELRLPAVNNSLERLIIGSCGNIKKLDISACKNIEQVNVSYCRNLTEITTKDNSKMTMCQIRDCPHLKNVDLSSCDQIKHIAILGDTNVIVPNNPSNTIDVAGSSRAVKSTLRHAGVELREDVELKARNIEVIDNNEQAEGLFRNATTISEVRYDDGVLTVRIKFTFLVRMMFWILANAKALKKFAFEIH
jgi:hypothetical protein